MLSKPKINLIYSRHGFNFIEKTEKKEDSNEM